MPSNEHSARVRDPKDFQQDSFRRINITDGVDLINGKLTGEDSMTAQAYRFDTSKFTTSEAKKWCEDNDVNYISFEEATNAKVVEGHIFAYGEVIPWQDKNAAEYGGVNLKDIVNQINANKEATRLVVHIHSPGGDVWEGFAIHDALANSGKEVETIIEGLCASIATIIALAGDRRLMTQHSEFMIHNPWAFSVGDSEDFKKVSDELSKTENKVADFYAAKTNLTADKLLEYMHNETFFTAEEAKQYGFVTEIVNTMRQVAKIHNSNFNIMDTNDKMNLLDKFIGRLEKLFQKSIMVADVNGNELDFPELADISEIKVGAKVNISGNPAEGDHLMPDGRTFVCAAGVLSEIKEKPADNTEEVKKENASLKTEIEKLKTEKTAIETQFNEVKTQTETVIKEFNDFKKQFSKGNTAGATPPAGDLSGTKVRNLLKIKEDGK